MAGKYTHAQDGKQPHPPSCNLQLAPFFCLSRVYFAVAQKLPKRSRPAPMAEDISNSLKIEEDSEGTSAVECPIVASSSSHSSSPSCDLQRKTSSTASQQEKRSKSSSSARSSSSGSGGSSSYSVRKTRPNTAVLIQWILDNSRHPYPTKLEKEDLARRAWMNLRQLNDWFANVRRNIKKKGFDKWKRRHTASTASLCFLSNEGTR